MRFSLLQPTPNYMYRHNSYVQTPAVVPLTMEAFVAPADFDPDAQELNIVEAFAAYSDVNKKYVFSVGTSTTTVLPAVTGRSYSYAENGGAYTSIASGTVTWTVGSMKRHVIVNDISSAVVATIPLGGIWSYCGDKVFSIISVNTSYHKYFHFENLNSLTDIGGNGLYNCNGATGILTIPSSIAFIGSSMFARCSSLTSMTMTDSVTSIGSYAFQNCSGLTSIRISNSVTIIDANTFQNCSGITSLILPPNLTNISTGAFSNCSSITGLLSITSALNTITDGAFSGTSFTTIESNSPNFEVFQNTLYNISSDIKAIYSCKSNSGILTFKPNIKYIALDCFQGCTGFTGSLVIPNTVISIGSTAFNGCNFSGAVVFPNSLNSIAYGLIANNLNFTGLEIPSSILTIGDAAFINCTRVISIKNYKVTPQTGLGSSTFGGINKTTCILHVPVGSLAAYQAATYWQDFTNIIDDL